MSRSRSIHVFVLIDALGWTYVDGRDFLSDLLPYRRPLRTILGYSSGAIPTILTGRPPVEHGHWNLFYYDPDESPFRWLRHFGFLPDVVLNSRPTRKVLKELGRRVLGLGPLFECCVSPRFLPWFNFIEKRNIYQCAGINGAPSIFDQLAAAGVPHRVYTYHRWTDAEILRLARRDIAASEATFFFLYLSEIDSLLHHHCEDQPLLKERFAFYEAELREILNTARRHDPEASLTIFSDHGMTPVRHHHDLAGEISTLGLGMPTDYLAVYDSTMARFWFFTERARRRVVARLEGLTCGRILTDDDLESLGIRFPDRRYGHLVFLLNPGWLISSSDFNAAGWQPTGMHGYHPDDSYSDAIFLSTHEPPVPMRTITDAYASMLHASGLQGAIVGPPRP